jgi:hypothetical protein
LPLRRILRHSDRSFVIPTAPLSFRPLLCHSDRFFVIPDRFFVIPTEVEESLKAFRF